MLSPSPNFLPTTPESNQKPGPSNVDLFHLDENGELNLSNNGLKKLDNHHKNVYQKAVSVNLSKNLFATIDGMIMFSNCTKMNVSYNKLQRLTCFLPLRDKLKYLDISNNQLISVDHLEKFVLLSHFDASHNKLESMKYVDTLNNLVYLNLAYNQLKYLPKLDKLQNLEELNLRGNQIRSLEDITVTLPLKLNKFDIGENLVNDLSEIQYLAPFTELETLHFAGNPCVKEEGREFSYRPFVYSCILSKLKIIDGYILSEEEVLKGEWLHAQGKAKSFRPQTGTHLALCEYLTQECPLDATGNPLKTENDVRLLKVLQKRREYLSHSEDDSSLSVSIPLRTPSQKNSPQTYLSPSGKRGLRTASPKRPLDFSTSPKSRNSSRTSIFPIKSVSTTADEESPSSMASDLSSSTIVLSRVDEVEPFQVTVCESAKKPSDDYQRQLHVPTVHEVVENRYLESIPEASKEDRLVSPTPVIRRTRSRVTVSDRLIFNEQSSTSNDIGKTMNEEKAATLIQSWWRGSKVRRRLVDAKLQFAVDSNRSKIAALQNQLDKVIEENERLTTITEEQMNAINTMSKQIKEMQESIEGLQKFQLVVKHLVPTPVSLVYQRDLENNSLVLTWENTIPLLSVVKGYKLFADGESIGEVVASNKRARITDLEPEKEHRIAIQAISSFGLTSAISEVVVPKLDSDDKENLHQTKPDPSRKE